MTLEANRKQTVRQRGDLARLPSPDNHIRSARPLSRRWECACDYLEEDVSLYDVRVLPEVIAAGWFNPYQDGCLPSPAPGPLLREGPLRVIFRGSSLLGTSGVRFLSRHSAYVSSVATAQGSPRGSSEHSRRATRLLTRPLRLDSVMRRETHRGPLRRP
jgi:hypothetical protein